MKKIFTLFAATLCAVMINATTEGALNGKFTVNADGDQVQFAQGNLRATTTDLGEHWTWSFATNQWDVIARTVANNAINGNGTVSENGTVDLFGWSTANTFFGINNSTDNSDYSGNFVDWGKNPISNGGNTANQWRTLSKDEWEYILNTRDNHDNLRGHATVNSVKGFILLPDNWTIPSGLSFTAMPSNWTTNTYSAEQWAQMESAGAVFLPQEGYRYGSNPTYGNSSGYYQSSTPHANQNSIYTMNFRYDNFTVANITGNRYCGYSVRLVLNENAVVVPAKFAVTITQPAHGSITIQETTVDLTAVDEGTTLHFIATPETDYEFDGWLGCAQDGSITVLDDATITCAFSKTVTKPASTALFTIDAEGKQVIFSQGNLQYCANTDTWRFAAEQYDAVGPFNHNIAANYAGWIDLFGWGTGNNPTQTSNLSTNYDNFADWGINAINNGGNEANQWRTLTGDEWKYIFASRTNASTLFAFGSVNGVNGIILLPDNWVLPDGAAFNPNGGNYEGSNGYYDSSKDHFANNSYTSDQWNVMESAGAVFLPICGYREQKTVNTLAAGYYYSATGRQHSNGTLIADNLFFSAYALKMSAESRYRGMAVRLVKDHQQPTAVNNVRDNVQCTKRIVNGQMVIEKNGKLYNAFGAEVR